VRAVAAAKGRRAVVACVAPGAALTPWAGEVGAVTYAFLPGQRA